MGYNGIACKNIGRQREQAGNIAIVKAQHRLELDGPDQR